MRTFAKSQIRYSKSQRIGIFAFIVLLIGIEAYDILFNKTYHSQLVEESFLISDHEKFETSEFTIDLVDTLNDVRATVSAQSSQTYYSPSSIQIIQEQENTAHQNISFQFDPNSNVELDWMNLGFTEEQAIAIIDCKNNLGGYFKTKDEIENCLVNHKEKYRTIEPYIKFESAKTIEATIDLIEEIEHENISDFGTIELIEE